MSTTDETSDPLVEALRRKVNYQADRIDELEDTIVKLETTIEDLRYQLQEVEE